MKNILRNFEELSNIPSPDAVTAVFLKSDITYDVSDFVAGLPKNDDLQMILRNVKYKTSVEDIIETLNNSKNEELFDVAKELKIYKVQ